MHRLAVTSSSGSNAEKPPQKKNNSSPKQSSLLLLPNDCSLNCLARVPRCYHPSVSMVSTALRRLIASPQHYAERSALRRTEHVLYVAIRSSPEETPRWYTLNLKPFRQESGVSLVPVPSFPAVPPWGMSVVTVGTEIYVIGGCVYDKLVSTGFVIDCPSYTCRSLPRMKQARGCAAAGIVGGKLYVVGGCKPKSRNWIEAFDLETQTWETVTTGAFNEVEVYEKTIRSFVMDDKIWIMDRVCSFVYDPKEGKLERDLLVNKGWGVGSCVIDDKLYSFGQRNTIGVFDPVGRVWRGVKGLEKLPDKREGSKLVNYGGKLVILVNRQKCSTEIWYTEIELERRRGGEVWGRVLSSKLVLALEESYSILRSLSVAF